jgi:hypothetical protein
MSAYTHCTALDIPTHDTYYSHECLFLIIIIIVTCRVVSVTKMTGSSSDDWIY